MKRRENPFLFKKFKISHHRSSIKVGVDAVLLGAWATSCGERFLDVGTGCGVIALMIAQRNPEISGLAIDIDSASVMEAKENFVACPWPDRLESREISFSELYKNEDLGKFDLIISNPPFFDSGVSDLESPRLIARHKGLLSPDKLVRNSSELLGNGGRLAIIIPTDRLEAVRLAAVDTNLIISRIQKVAHHPGAVEKRVMVEFLKQDAGEEKSGPLVLDSPDTLYLFETDGNPTDEYRRLCKDFYLKF